MYRPPSQRRALSYKPSLHRSSMHSRRSPNSRWVGASILPFSVSPSGYVYFLLGQEAEHKGYKESGKWSEFGGGASLNENEFTCAAREFVEETQKMVHPFPTKYGHVFPSIEQIASELKQKHYTARIDFNFLNTRFLKTYTTFLVQIPWNPSLCVQFNNHMKSLTRNRQSFSQTNGYRNFQGKLSRQRHTIEKSTIQYFSIPELNGESKRRRTPRDNVPIFRRFFQRRVRKILKLVFPNNMQPFRNLNDLQMCREMYQGANHYVALPKYKDRIGKHWTRGVAAPNTLNTPSSKMFEHFNTQRKYPYTTIRKPVDKIYG